MTTTKEKIDNLITNFRVNNFSVPYYGVADFNKPTYERVVLYSKNDDIEYYQNRYAQVISCEPNLEYTGSGLLKFKITVLKRSYVSSTFQKYNEAVNYVKQNLDYLWQGWLKPNEELEF